MSICFLIYERKIKLNLREIQINLIKQGRMHNQGFIKFKNEENAQAVLENLNGFYFYEKPLIIVNLYMIIKCKKFNSCIQTKM